MYNRVGCGGVDPALFLTCRGRILLCGKEIRPCIDYSGLNDITVKNKYPLPLIDSAFGPLHSDCVFTKLDLRNDFHLVRIREGGTNGKRHSTRTWDTLTIWKCHLD